jgi:hypothetical protein
MHHRTRRVARSAAATELFPRPPLSERLAPSCCMNPFPNVWFAPLVLAGISHSRVFFKKVYNQFVNRVRLRKRERYNADLSTFSVCFPLKNKSEVYDEVIRARTSISSRELHVLVASIVLSGDHFTNLCRDTSAHPKSCTIKSCAVFKRHQYTP